MDLEQRRALVKAVVASLVLVPVGKGRKPFNPDHIQITWRCPPTPAPLCSSSDGLRRPGRDEHRPHRVNDLRRRWGCALPTRAGRSHQVVGQDTIERHALRGHRVEKPHRRPCVLHGLSPVSPSWCG